MSIIIITFFIFFYQIINIYCNAKCNKETNLAPTLKYHCSGLTIDNFTNEGDTHCCLWKYVEENKENNSTKTITRCSSINQNQYDGLEAYIKKKRNQNYLNLEIECTDDQKLYCSNVVLDEEDIDDCSKLLISIEDDKFCCRWIFKDSTNHHKNNNYCASINEFEYLNIKSYIRYKNDHPDQRYDDLSIDCTSRILKLTGVLYLLFLII